MRTLTLLCFLAAPGWTQTLIDTDFGGPYQPVTGNPRASGVLPAGWRDNSSFAQVWIDYSRQEEAGRAFLRFEVTRVDTDWAQITASLPRLEADTYIRLSIMLRDPDRLQVGLGVRRSGSPYNYLWEKNRVYPAGWSEYTYYGRVSRADYDVGFWIVVRGVGKVDFARFRLDRVTLDDIRRDFIEHSPDGGPTNLVRISRFPLGLQTGWMLDRDSSDGDEVTIGPDTEVIGPSGAPALHIQSARNMQLYTAPVGLPHPVEPHTGSIYLRGRASGRLAAVGDGAVLAAQSFSLSGAEWQRVPVRFTPNLLGRIHGLRLEASGDFWMDALQVERGPQATAYEAQGACEVSLAVDSPIRVQFDDEPALVRYAVTGRVPGAILRSRVFNLYDQEQLLPGVALGAGFRNDGLLKYDVFSGRPYGAFRIEAWVEDREGLRVSPYNELIVLRLPQPRYWMQDAPDSPFGAHTNSTTRHILMAKAAGINWTRLHDAGTPYIGWYHLERQPGQWTPRDAELYRYRQYGMKILGAFATAPEWASYFDKPRNSYFDRYYQPRELEPFANYVRLIAERYAGVIDTYDLWNEPWIPGYWAVGYDESKKDYIPSATPQEDFARLTRVAAEAAKSVDPAIRILGVNSTTGQGSGNRIGGQEWTRGVAAAGGVEPCDIVCYHQYAGPEAVELGYQTAIGPVLGERPVWMTEGSSLSGRMGNGLYRHTLPYEEEEDVVDNSDRLCRFLIKLLAQGVEKAFLYSMHTHNWFGGGNAYRVLVTEDGYLHPAAAAHSAMAWLLEDTKFARAETVAEGVRAYVFEGDGRIVTVLLPDARHAPYALPQDALDLFGNAVSKGEALGSRLTYMISGGAGN